MIVMTWCMSVLVMVSVYCKYQKLAVGSLFVHRL